jgi:ATP-dependent protease HslVU (ClpYQ) peptidase subunit
MSTIVAVKTEEEVVLAADSLSSYGTTRLSSKFDAAPSKIFQAKDSYIGVVGSAAHFLVLRDLLTSSEDDYSLTSIEGIFSAFRKIHPILKKEYFLKTEEEDESPYESSQMDILIANETGIFGVHSLREVFSYQHFWATGSGWTFALGAMHTHLNRSSDALSIAMSGIEAAAEFDQGSALPSEHVIIPRSVAAVSC